MDRIFSGIQPSGEIHIGNYVGAIRNWVRLVDRYDCIYCVVDYHAITIEYDVTLMQQRILETATVLVASGLTPDKCIVFVQSHVPEHMELTWIFNCVTPVGELERMTQFKEKGKQHRHNVNVGLLDYPVLQTADILIYKAGYVPVGEDQIQHVEFSREIARKFNARFGETFPEPSVLLSDAPRILGTDGNAKMSKSLNNAIGLLDPPEVIWEKLRIAATCPHRQRRTDPGHPEHCNIFTMHRAFSKPDQIAMVDHHCRTAGFGCIDCKQILFKSMVEELGPIQNRVKEMNERPGYIVDVLKTGATRCKVIAGKVMDEARTKIGLKSEWL
ncbi:MAG: tryptophan--tRNA ligase [Deltaproteobacteria bacterium RBG_16_49_23]|nr:MAG: tryptophan--tRNA ligase [Deltaproteobacteria bacterium RBG_16_49_23]